MPDVSVDPVPVPTPQKKALSPILIAALVLLYIGLNIGVYLLATKTSFFKKYITKTPIETPAVAPTKKPVYVLPSGTQTYTFSHGKKVVGPKLGKVTLDPLTPENNTVQKLTVTITNDSPVTSAQVTLITDSDQKTYPLQRTNGTNQDGTWTTEWNMIDTYEQNYRLKFDLKSSTGDYSGSMTFR
jgi:hypothetical protein